jgi:hypothetical protein
MIPGIDNVLDARTDGLSAGVLVRVDRDVEAVICDIRRIGRILESPQTVNHPYVKRALSQLDKQLAGVLGQAQGRHRAHARDISQADAVVQDAYGYNLKPNPLTATTPAELVCALRRYREWSGNVPFRQMAAAARYAVAHSTMCVALSREELPALKVVLAIVIGCGGSATDQERFATAWRQIQSGTLQVPVVRLIGK